MKTDLIKTSLERTISYDEYFSRVEAAANGDLMYHNENMDYYTQLNHQRMKRLNKTVKLSEELVKAGDGIACDLTFLVLTEGWCGDAAQILPVLNKVDEAIERITVKFLYRDQNLELMDLFLTNGGRSIPKVIVVDNNTLEIKGDWGPRPTPAQDMFMVYKNSEIKTDYKEFQVEMQKWYAKDKSEHIQKELMPLFDLCHNVTT